MLTVVRHRASWLWRHRRWAYALYMLVGILRIPARTGFHLYALRCDWHLTATNASRSLTKLPHIVLFGCFFLLTAAQFDTIDRRSLAWSFAATVGLGLLIEIQEGVTRTGNCRFTDVLPDALGGLIVMALLVAARAIAGHVVHSSGQAQDS